MCNKVYNNIVYNLTYTRWGGESWTIFCGLPLSPLGTVSGKISKKLWVVVQTMA
jgi:hypothetical protein